MSNNSEPKELVRGSLATAYSHTDASAKNIFLDDDPLRYTLKVCSLRDGFSSLRVPRELVTDAGSSKGWSTGTAANTFKVRPAFRDAEV